MNFLFNDFDLILYCEIDCLPTHDKILCAAKTGDLSKVLNKYNFYVELSVYLLSGLMTMSPL